MAINSLRRVFVPVSYLREGTSAPVHRGASHTQRSHEAGRSSAHSVQTSGSDRCLAGHRRDAEVGLAENAHCLSVMNLGLTGAEF